jgi:hypothetical protein
MSFAPSDIVGEQSTPEANRIADFAGVLIDHLARVKRLPLRLSRVNARRIQW